MRSYANKRSVALSEILRIRYAHSKILRITDKSFVNGGRDSF